MKPQFPTGREEKRQALLRAVECVRGVIAFGADEAEELRTLLPASVAASHLMVSDSSYENYGQFLLELPGADPMG